MEWSQRIGVDGYWTGLVLEWSGVDWHRLGTAMGTIRLDGGLGLSLAGGF